MSEKEIGQSNDLNEQKSMAFSYVIEEDDNKKKETLTPAEGIPMMARSMSSLSFAADDSRVEVLAESLIDTQKNELAFMRDLAKNHQETIKTKKVKITKLKEKLANLKSKAAAVESKVAKERSNHAQELQVKDAEIKNL